LHGLIQSNGSVSRSQDTCVADQLRACSGGSAAVGVLCGERVGGRVWIRGRWDSGEHRVYERQAKGQPLGDGAMPGWGCSKCLLFLAQLR
jgi:hypothetical protein